MSKRTSKRRTSRHPARISRNSVTTTSAWSDTEADFRQRSAEARKILLAQHDPTTLLDISAELIEVQRIQDGRATRTSEPSEARPWYKRFAR
jgi:KaiC/GvpD/RAD55 family RecA-like ATPase